MDIIRFPTGIRKNDGIILKDFKAIYQKGGDYCNNVDFEFYYQIIMMYIESH